MRIKLAKLHKKNQTNGEAYGFLDFKDEKDIDDIEKELSRIERNELKKYYVHPNLEIDVIKTNPADIHPNINEYKVGEYVLKATLPGATHEETAYELGHTLNLLYKGLEPSGIEAGYKKHDKFHYEDKGKFHHLRKKSHK